MNRLASLIDRRPRRAAAFPAPPFRTACHGEEKTHWLDDAKLFATGYVGGIVVFGTFIA